MTIEATPFTPVSAALGGLLIGLGALVLMAGLGRISGISGILSQAILPADGQRAWRGWFIGGLLLGAAACYHFAGLDFPLRTGVDAWVLALAGALVGLGTGIGSGCTSGHGICGIARVSRRSLVAVLTFMLTGFITTYLVRHVLGGLP